MSRAAIDWYEGGSATAYDDVAITQVTFHRLDWFQGQAAKQGHMYQGVRLETTPGTYVTYPWAQISRVDIRQKIAYLDLT